MEMDRVTPMGDLDETIRFLFIVRSMINASYSEVRMQGHLVAFLLSFLCFCSWSFGLQIEMKGWR